VCVWFGVMAKKVSLHLSASELGVCYKNFSLILRLMTSIYVVSLNYHHLMMWRFSLKN